MISAVPHPLQACTTLQELCFAGLWPPALQTSALPAMPPRPAQPWTIFTLQACTPKACKARDPHTHNLHSAARASKPVKPGIHTHAGSPFHWPVPFRHTKPMLQRPTTSPQLRASTQSPVGHHPLLTCYREAPNLPNSHTQTSLDAKELASEQLRLQFYRPRTGDFFFFSPSLRDLLPVLLFDHSLPEFFFSFPHYPIPFIFPSLSLFLSFFLGFVSINTVTQLVLNYT
jgi:hypothetical protein